MSEPNDGFPEKPLGDTPADPFERLEGKDGFHVVKIEVGREVSIHAQAYAGGELCNLIDPLHPENNTVEVASWPNATNRDQGEATRLHLVLDAVARYLTTGGDWESLYAALHRVRKVAFGNLVFPGYHYLDGYVTTEGTYQHIFVKDDGSGEAVLWEEPAYTDGGGLCGGFIDRTTLEKIKKDQEEDESIWGTREPEAEAAEAEEPPASPSPLQLPDRTEPGASGPPGGDHV